MSKITTNEQKYITKEHKGKTFRKSCFFYKAVLKGIINGEIQIIDFDVENDVLYFSAPCNAEESKNFAGIHFWGTSSLYYDDYISLDNLIFDLILTTKECCLSNIRKAFYSL